MATEKDLLLRARDLIKQRQYAEARAILTGLPDSTIAQEWLTKLDQLDPPAPAAVPAARASASPYNMLMMRYAVGGVTALMAVILIVGFFMFSWLDGGELMGDFGGMVEEAGADASASTFTAMEIWMGSNGDQDFTLDFSNVENGGGLSDVRLLDRTLILIPVLAVILLWVAWVYATDHRNSLQTAAILAGLALVLLAYPFLWESLSKSDWENDLKDVMMAESGGEDFGFAMIGLSFIMELITELYSTTEFKMAAGIAFLFAVVAVALEYMAANQPRPAAPPTRPPAPLSEF
ncbi:MAG: hypothetical protein JXQ72_00555 [Anaerolineae bacterium]|nr:hypothetical protein [Anaerolineae bacterium]